MMMMNAEQYDDALWMLVIGVSYSYYNIKDRFRLQHTHDKKYKNFRLLSLAKNIIFKNTRAILNSENLIATKMSILELMHISTVTMRTSFT